VKKNKRKNEKETSSHTHSHPTAPPLKLIIIEAEKLDCAFTNILKKQLRKKGRLLTVLILQTKPQTLQNVHMKLQQGGLTNTQVEMEISIITKMTKD